MNTPPVENVKTVERVASAPAPHMVGDGFRVHTFIPSEGITQRRMSPFLMLDYNALVEYPPSNHIRGVGVHPHRGFETVSVAYHGRIAHHDSYGNSGVIAEGDVQWMTAGSGILHKEYHDTAYAHKGGPFQMAQLWVNLPKAHKMTTPKYQDIKHDSMGVYMVPNNGGKIEVIAGQYLDAKGPATTFTPLNMFNARLNQNASVNFSFAKNHNTAFLIVSGQVLINGKTSASADQFVLFANDGSNVSLQATTDAIVLVLDGEPINDPIASYGPFVMNTHEEIQQAITDFNSGKFGYLRD